MNKIVNNETSLEKKFSVKIPYKKISEKMEEDFLNMSKNLKLAGFRPGKIPISFVKSKYSKEVLARVSEKLLQEEGNKTFEKQGYRLASQPQVKLLSEFKENSDLEAEFSFEILPIIEFKDLKSINLEKFEAKIEKKEIDKVVEKLFNDNKQFNKINNDRNSKEGDRLVINFKGYLDDKLFEGGSADNVNIELGNNNFLPEFGENLLERSKKDNISFDVTFPKDYNNDNLKGRKAKFEVQILDILEPKILKDEDLLAKSTGAKDSKDLREKIKKELERYSEELSFSLIKHDIIKYLEGNHKFMLPKTLVEKEYEAILQNYKPGNELKKEEIENKKKKFKDEARKKVKTGLLISEIGVKNKIVVTNKELEGELAKICMQYPGKEKEIIEHYKQNPNSMSALKGPLFENKVIKYILEAALVKKITISNEELTKKIESMHKKLNN